MLTFPFPLTVAYLGNPDWGVIITSYIGSFLLAGGFLAIGAFFSALSKNQVVSFILAVVACAVLAAAGWPSTLNFLSSHLPMSVVNVVESMSIQTHFESLQRGVLQLRDIAYFVLLITGWVIACSVMLEERKAA